MSAGTVAAGSTSPARPPADLALSLAGIEAGYGRLTVLRDFALTVRSGEVVALLGPNGAGKTTALRAAAGLLRPTRGRIELAGTDVTATTAHQRARLGICLIPEGRAIYRNLSVRENLRLFARTGGVPVDEWIEGELAGPLAALAGRLDTPAGRLSGGQQQILALSRATLSRARIVMVDEASMGLAPMVVDEVFASLRSLIASGAGVLLVEQYVDRALDLADRVVLLDRGEIRYSGPASAVDRKLIAQGYLGDGR